MHVLTALRGPAPPWTCVRRETWGPEDPGLHRDALTLAPLGLGHSRCCFSHGLVLCRHLPTSQSPKPGTAYVIGTAFPGRAQSWNSQGCRCIGTWWGVCRALPTQCLVTLSNIIPSLKYLGLVGLSLQLKLKHGSRQASSPFVW